MTWTLPGLGRITSPYGPRKLAGAVSDFHAGTDLGTKRTAVYAAQDGIVRTIWKTTRGAWVLDIRHADERGQQVRTRYIHMLRNEIAVAVGQRVTAGQVVGKSGASGTTAAHLHFEVLVGGANVDPVPFMAARGVQLGTTTIANPGGGVGTVPTVPGVTTPTPITQEDDTDMSIIYRALDSHGLINKGWTYLQGDDGVLRPLTAKETGALAQVHPGPFSRIAEWSGIDLDALAKRCGLVEYVGTAAEGDPLGYTGRIIGRDAPQTGAEPRGGSDTRHYPITQGA